MGYIVPGEGQIENLYVTDSWLVEQFAGDRLWAWGLNGNGQLGDNTTVNKSSPVQTVASGTNWKQVSGGTLFAAGVKTDGSLWGWGFNSSGQLGTNTVVSPSSPVQTSLGGTNWKQVACGVAFTSVIKTDGTLWSYGTGTIGQLGDGTIVSKSSPVQTIAVGTNWKQVSCGSVHAAAIKTDGTLWTWGNNSNGQLGDSTIAHKSSPIQTTAGGTNWKQVSCGSVHAAAIKTDGTLWTWGNNSNGQLGDNTTVFKSSPIQTTAGGTNWKQVACGNGITGGIKTDGTLWNWGNNLAGQLGDNTLTQRNTPIQTVAGGTNWKNIGIGSSASSNTSAVKTDGTLWIWGLNTNGQLGNNSTTNISSPIQTIAGGTNWKSVCTGSATYAISINNINTTGVE